MTPQEKAKELVEKYYQSYLDNDVYGDYTNGPKDGALIAGDEILNELPEGSIDYGVSARRRFFEEVKQEIEKLRRDYKKLEI